MSWLQPNVIGCHNASFKRTLITIWSNINDWWLIFPRSRWLIKVSPWFVPGCRIWIKRGLLYVIRQQTLGPGQNKTVNIVRPKPSVMTNSLFISLARECHPRVERSIGIHVMGRNASVARECHGGSCCQAIFWRLAPVPTSLTPFPMKHSPR